MKGIKQFTTDEQKTFFTAHLGEHAGGLNYKTLLDMTKPYTGFSCLEVGSGKGQFLQYFKRKRHNKCIFGIDIAPHTQFVLKGDCTSLYFPDKTFNTVFCYDVIEHLSDGDLAKCISEVHRMLKVGGYAIFTTKNAEDLAKRVIACPECGCSFHCNGHCQSFTVDDIIRLFTSNGFRIVKIRTMNIGYVSSIGLLAKLFYFFRLQKIFRQKLFVGDIFCVVQKDGSL